ncbi:MAG: cupredoxin domain-containing protein [Pseudomonadales bacterium]|nr:cupredoxin domain-containing protein [Pseudomonadales bacterium]MCP5216101.1 cupredoxin domain-containing protein [Pseudomonadales bacterium]
MIKSLIKVDKMMGQYLCAVLNNKHLFLVIMLILANLAQADTVEVEIFKKQYIPQELTINKGDTVRWVNKEKRQYHSVYFEALDEKDGEYFWPDEVFERTFERAGSFPYRCGPHPEMTGIIHVRGDDK